MTVAYHLPVMLGECLEGLAIRPEGTYVDVTFGGGGHSRGILQQLGAQGRLFAFDQDPDAAANTPQDGRFGLIASNFRFLKEKLAEKGIYQIDGLLADLGVSSHQLDDFSRGFSYRELHTPLDMRMDPSQGTPAQELLNELDENQLYDILANYGELEGSGRAARAIVRYRSTQPLQTTADLLTALSGVGLPPAQHRNTWLSKLYQGLRIAVNDEMAALHELLTQSIELLKPGGRLVVLSYHSLEDRLVKHFMAAGNARGEVPTDFYGNRLSPLKPLTRKPLQASEAEVEANPRARSARLRIAEKNVVPHLN